MEENMNLDLPKCGTIAARFFSIAICGVASLVIGAAQADELDRHTTVANASICPTCFRAEAKTAAVGAPPREDTLGPTLCRSAMSSSPPLAPLCGRYR